MVKSNKRATFDKSITTKQKNTTMKTVSQINTERQALRELFSSLSPTTLEAIAQDLYDAKNWRGLDRIEQDAFDFAKSAFKNNTGEEIELTYKEAI